MWLYIDVIKLCESLVAAWWWISYGDRSHLETLFYYCSYIHEISTRIGNLISIIFCFDENFSTPIIFICFIENEFYGGFSKYYSSYSYWPTVMKQVSLVSRTGGLQKLRYRFLNFVKKNWKLKKNYNFLLFINVPRQDSKSKIVYCNFCNPLIPESNDTCNIFVGQKLLEA